MGLLSFIKEALHENDEYLKAAKELVNKKCTLSEYKDWARVNAYDKINALDVFTPVTTIITNHELYSNVKIVNVSFMYDFSLGSTYYNIKDETPASSAVNRWIRHAMNEVTGELSNRFGKRFDYKITFKKY